MMKSYQRCLPEDYSSGCENWRFWHTVHNRSSRRFWHCGPRMQETPPRTSPFDKIWTGSSGLIPAHSAIQLKSINTHDKLAGAAISSSDK